MDKVDAVVHLAAITGVDDSFVKSKLVEEVNYQGTVKVLETCIEKGVERMIYASSCNVYGNSVKQALNEEDDVTPINHYANAKYKVTTRPEVFFLEVDHSTPSLTKPNECTFELYVKLLLNKVEFPLIVILSQIF